MLQTFLIVFTFTQIIPHPDFIVPVEIDNQYHNVYVLKRPGVDEFMRKMGEKYEIVVFTASLSKVSLDAKTGLIYNPNSLSSMPILSWICSMSTR